MNVQKVVVNDLNKFPHTLECIKYSTEVKSTVENSIPQVKHRNFSSFNDVEIERRSAEIPELTLVRITDTLSYERKFSTLILS